MSECKNRRAIKPLNSDAVKIANKFQPSCSNSLERKKWMDAYIKAGGQWECADPENSTPGEILLECTDKKAGKGDLIVQVVNEITSENVFQADVQIKLINNSSVLNKLSTDCEGKVFFTEQIYGQYTIDVDYENLKMFPPSQLCNINSENSFKKINIIPDPHSIGVVSQTDASVFFSQYEDDPNIPNSVMNSLLSNFIDKHRSLIRELIRHVQCKKPPLGLDKFFQIARGIFNDDLTALLACHNVTKAMSRGRSPIGWSSVSRSPLKYSLNGTEYEFDLSKTHANALTKINGRNTAFYMFFNSSDLGIKDPGDWYHFYLMAYATYASKEGIIQFDVDNRGSYFTTNYASQIAGAISDLSGEMLSEHGGSDSNEFRGWRWANCLSYLEGGFYGDSQKETTRESKIHRKGAYFGLQKSGVRIPDSWRWYISKPKSLSYTNMRADLDDETSLILDSNGKELSNDKEPGITQSNRNSSGGSSR